MRAAVLHLAFAGLGAREAESDAFTDNHASNKVSHISSVMVQSAGSFLPTPEFSEDQEAERREHQNDPDVGYQPLREVVPEEQDVHADHDGYQREHVHHDAYLSCHGLVLHDGVGQVRRTKVTSPLGQYVRRSRTLCMPSAARSNRTPCRGWRPVSRQSALA
jgi:hypothetical protein